jgi:hypothetical protein
MTVERGINSSFRHALLWPCRLGLYKAPGKKIRPGLRRLLPVVGQRCLELGPFEGLGPDIVEAIRRIKSQDGPDLILWGSSTLASTLLEHGLADEVLLIVFQRHMRAWGRGGAVIQSE